LPIITLTTDFGTSDSYVAAMKGVILGVAPQARIVDISHEVKPQDVAGAAYLLQGVVPFYPPGTIHVVVVDPGVGGRRRPIAVRTSHAMFVGPDNGVFSHVWQEADEPVETCHLDQPRYWLPRVSATFHGRDLFAPVAAHLAAGVPFGELGTPIDDPVILPLPEAQQLADGRILGQVVHSDRFGNLISNVPGTWLAGSRWLIQVAGRQLFGPSLTYAEVASGQLVALIGSGGRLEVAVRDGSAAAHLAAQAGEPIELIPHETRQERSR
jgi:S-adenosylmethionine hydrolase